MSSATVFLKKNDSPRSPCRSLPSQMPNCTADRLVQAELLADVVDLLGGGVVAGDDRRRIARREAQQQEDQHRHHGSTGMVASRRRAMNASMAALPFHGWRYSLALRSGSGHGKTTDARAVSMIQSPVHNLCVVDPLVVISTHPAPIGRRPTTWYGEGFW